MKLMMIKQNIKNDNDHKKSNDNKIKKMEIEKEIKTNSNERMSYDKGAIKKKLKIMQKRNT